MKETPTRIQNVEQEISYPALDKADFGATKLKTKDLSSLVECSLFDLLLAATSKASSSGETTLADNLLNLLVVFTYETAQATPRTKQPGNLGMVIALSRLIGTKQSHVKTILQSVLKDSLIVPHVA